MLLRNARLVLDPARGVFPGWLMIRDGVIEELGLGEGIPKEDVPTVDCQGDFLAPGLIDIHAHGAMGRDAMEASGEAFETILSEHALHGTTTMLLATVAASPEAMLEVLGMAESWSGFPGAARLEGIHLEGPWFSPRRRGAHAPERIRDPEDTEVSRLLGRAAKLRRVTLAPELPGASEAIHRLVREGIVVSAGHSDATEEEALVGFAAGITAATHLHNAMSSLRKTDPPRRGLAEAALNTPGILCELIADGVHVSAELLKEAFLAKGWRQIALVSDATPGAGLAEGAPFRLGDLDCRVEEGCARTAGHTLAGSTRFLFCGVRAMMECAGVSLSEAVAMASLTPAVALGLEKSIGSIEVGKNADLIRFSGGWHLKGVWLGGIPLS
jgi:N-acetylglucosamine-6-phosphate deacetylase